MILKNFRLNILLKNKRILLTKKEIEELLTPENIKKFKLDRYITKLIKATGNIDKYLLPGQTKEKVARFSIANVIRATGNIEAYLTQDNIDKYELDKKDEDTRAKKHEIRDLIIATENIGAYLTRENIDICRLNEDEVTDLIKATGNIEAYLTPDNINEFHLNIGNVSDLIKATGNIEAYLTPNNINDYKLYGHTLADLAVKAGKAADYLNPADINKYYFDSYSIAHLIEATENIGAYLTRDNIKNYKLEDRDIIRLIKATGKIKDYLTLESVKEYEFSDTVLRNLVLKLPNFSDEEKIILGSFNDSKSLVIVANLEGEKQKAAIKILERLSKSNSAAIRRVKNEMAVQILEEPPETYEETLKNIEDIYEKNNIPTFLKQYLVFEKLHPNFLGNESKGKKDESYANIPSLNKALPEERKKIILSDLFKCELESNSRNLFQYMDTLEKGDKLYRQLLSGKLNLDNLHEKDVRREILKDYTGMLKSFYKIINEGKTLKGEENDDLITEITSLYKDFSINPDRIIEYLGGYAGITTLEQAKEIMKNAREKAHEENKKQKIVLKKGDFVKGIADTRYFPSMLKNGIVAKDFHGGNAAHDFTPLDTDVEKVEKEGKNFNETFNKLSIAPRYTTCEVGGKKLGTIMVVFSGEDFIETATEFHVNEENIETLKENPEKKEVFCNDGSAYGIRTGLGSANIKYIISDRYVDKLGLEIAKNGFYIPIVNKDGEVIYTPEMYKEFRDKMQGLSYYGETEFVMDETAKNIGTEKIQQLVTKSKIEAKNKRVQILNTINEAIEGIGAKLSTERLLDLVPGFVELIDIGSTGRGTNLPGDGDFDFMVRMDKTLSEKPEKFKELLEKALCKKGEPGKKEVTDKGDFRYKKVKIAGLEKEVDIDLSFTERTDEIEYSTDECIKDRLSTIKRNNPEDYPYVVANILLAKKVLKDAKAYKKENAPAPEKGQEDTRGGLGAVGIENWVLQNGGSFEKAAETFLAAAEKSENLSEFVQNYAVWDFGESHTSAEKDIYPHDNFVYNMTEDGYKRMTEALRKYRESVKEERESGKAEKRNVKTERQNPNDKTGIADLVKQDIKGILGDTPEDTLYVKAVAEIFKRSNCFTNS